MTRAESKIFEGIFKQLRFFEQVDDDFSPQEIQGILESYESNLLPVAIEHLSVKMIQYVEDMPEFGSNSSGSMIN